MTDTATTKPPAAPRQATTRRPQVSVRPVAVGALNAAVIGGATVVTAGGGLVLAAAGAGAAAVGAAAASRKAGKAKATKQERTITFGRTTTSGSGGGLPRAGRSSAASPGRSAGSRSGSGSGRPSAGGRSAGAGSGSKLGSLFRKGRPGSNSPSGGGRGLGAAGRSTGSGRSGGAGGAGHRRAGSKPGASGSRSPLTADKVAAARRKLANRRQPGPRLSDAIRNATSPQPVNGSLNGKPLTRKPTPREAWSAARKAVTGDNPKLRGTIRRAVAGFAAAAVAADKANRDRWKARKRREAARQVKLDRIGARQQARPGVATAVRRASSQTGPAKTSRPAPQPIPRRASRSADNPNSPISTGGTVMSNSPSAMQKMLDLAEQMVEIATKFERPPGVMELLDREYAVLPQVQRTVAKAWKTMHARATDPVDGDPLPPVIMDLLDELYTHQLRGATTADQITPLAKRLEQIRIDALADPRNRMWDHRANQGHS